MSIVLAVFFFFTSLIYASLGFGGGSTYTALLVSFESNKDMALFISLICNVIVVLTSFFLYVKNRLLVYRIALPLVFISSCGSYLGASIHLSTHAFLQTFSIILAINATLLLVNWNWKALRKEETTPSKKWYPFYGLGVWLIGFSAGITSIGGGVFLSPFLHLYTRLPGKNIMAISSFFILVNACVSLVARRQVWVEQTSEVLSHYPLFIAVFIGGLLGTYLGIQRLKPQYVRQFTGVLLLIIAIRLFLKSL